MKRFLLLILAASTLSLPAVADQYRCTIAPGRPNAKFLATCQDLGIASEDTCASYLLGEQIRQRRLEKRNSELRASTNQTLSDAIDEDRQDFPTVPPKPRPTPTATPTSTPTATPTATATTQP